LIADIAKKVIAGHLRIHVTRIRHCCYSVVSSNTVQQSLTEIKSPYCIVRCC